MKVPSKIKLVNQNSDISCMFACVAMVAGKNLSTVVDVANELKIYPPCSMMEFMRLLTCFRILGVPEPLEGLRDNALYKVCVPSLNSQAGLHSIIIDSRGDRYEVYDPQNGMEGKKFYTRKNFKTFSLPIKIVDIRDGD